MQTIKTPAVLAVLALGAFSSPLLAMERESARDLLEHAMRAAKEMEANVKDSNAKTKCIEASNNCGEKAYNEYIKCMEPIMEAARDNRHTGGEAAAAASCKEKHNAANLACEKAKLDCLKKL